MSARAEGAALYTHAEALERVRMEFPKAREGFELIFLGEMGSTSHGTAGDVIDDYDLMGVVVPPPSYLIGLSRWEHWVRDPETDGLDVVLYSLDKYSRLALKANPNVVGLLWLRPENVLHSSDAWRRLVAERDVFSSKRAYHTFVGYAHSQLSKVFKGVFRGYMGDRRKALVSQFGYDTKNAAHLIRLLRMGAEFLRSGTMNVYRADREELMAIKRGEWSLERVQSEAELLFEDARVARDESPLPEEPDYAAVERLVMECHRQVLAERSPDA